MASDYTRQWIQFFTGCGIPNDVAARYGLIFNENRIQKNMLLDLNKEYLRDMGITVMGDIIAILRHAKVVHDKYIREQILCESEENLPVESLTSNVLTTIKSTPMKRMLEHYTRKCNSTELNVPPEKVHIHVENANSLVHAPKKLAHRVGVQNKCTVEEYPSVKQKIEAPSMRSDDLVPGKLEVPVPKLRRVLPENEGSYTIRMPSGTTERSKKLLEKAKLKQSKTVFDRLGESSVSSTSDVTTSGTTIQPAKVTNNKEKNTLSVFSRLGEKTSLVSSTSSNGNTAELSDQLPYRGILKTNTVKNKLGLSPNSTMRADNELNSSNTNGTKINKINLVKERLGTSLKANQSSISDSSLKLNRLQITTTFEENSKTESHQGQPLFKRFKSLKTSTGESTMKRKKDLDGLGSFRSEILQNKSNVTSTTQSSDIQRGIKRLHDTNTKSNDISDVAQSKKVRFGKTTQRLIPGNIAEEIGVKKEFHGVTVAEGYKKLETKKLTLTSGVRIGAMNSDKIRQKLSLKERIGVGTLTPKSGRVATELRKKRSLKFNNRLRKGLTNIHDRLG